MENSPSLFAVTRKTLPAKLSARPAPSTRPDASCGLPFAAPIHPTLRHDVTTTEVKQFVHVFNPLRARPPSIVPQRVGFTEVGFVNAEFLRFRSLRA